MTFGGNTFKFYVAILHAYQSREIFQHEGAEYAAVVMKKI